LGHRDTANSEIALKAAYFLWDYFFRQFALEQNLTSIAWLVPALEQVPAGHVTLVHTPPEQFPIPFIALAEASAVKSGDKLKIVNAIEATLIINFMK